MESTAPDPQTDERQTEQALAALIEAGLLADVAEGAEPAFGFRHALIHDAAYASLLRAERRRLHLRVGEALADRLTPGADPLDLPPRLGEHFELGGDARRAGHYFGLAGDGAARVYASGEAAHYYRRALESVEGEAERRQQLALGLGQSLELTGRHAEALEVYQDLEALGRRESLDAVELAGKMARARVHATLTPQHDPARARRLLDDALRLARRSAEPAAEARVLWNLMVLLTWSGEDFAGAIDYGRRAAELARQAGADEPLAFALNDLVYPLVATGQHTEALKASEEARRLWRSQGNLPMLVDGLCNAVLLHYSFGRFETGESCAAEAGALSERIGNLWGQTNSLLYVGQIERERGQLGKALATMETAIALGDRSRHPGALIAVRVDLGLLLSELGDADGGRRRIDEAEAIAGELQTWLRAYPPAARARLEVAYGSERQAQQAVEIARRARRPTGLQWSAPVHADLAAIELALRQGEAAAARETAAGLINALHATPERPFLPHALRLLGRALMDLGQAEEAAGRFEQACAAAREIGASWRLWPALLDAAEAAAARGETVGAGARRREAGAILRQVIESLPAGRLRSQFTARPEVAALVAA